jgi:hypothetical protein
LPVPPWPGEGGRQLDDEDRDTLFEELTDRLELAVAELGIAPHG